MKARGPAGPTRTTSMGLCTDAIEMTEAAEILLRENDRLTQPIYYLISHAFEVALKSVLRATGISLGDLKSKYGHDLSKSAQAVIHLELEEISGRIAAAYDALALLNVYYSQKMFEYRVTGAVRLPEPAELIRVLKETLPHIKALASPVLKRERNEGAP